MKPMFQLFYGRLPIPENIVGYLEDEAEAIKFENQGPDYLYLDHILFESLEEFNTYTRGKLKTQALAKLTSEEIEALEL